MSLKIAIAGAGRMGQTIAAAVTQAPDLELSGIWSRGESLHELIESSDVLIDFSLPSATDEVLRTIHDTSTPLVCGVSGLAEGQIAALEQCAQSVAIVFDRNMSLGVAVLQRCVSEAAAILGDEFAVRIEETHHIHKKDSPSGTALKLAEAISAVRGDDEIEFVVERRGEVPGDHAVTLSNASETLGFSHSVSTRQVFADGALRASRWIVGQKSGLYSMHDVLFSNAP